MITLGTLSPTSSHGAFSWILVAGTNEQYCMVPGDEEGGLSIVGTFYMLQVYKNTKNVET